MKREDQATKWMWELFHRAEFYPQKYHDSGWLAESHFYQEIISIMYKCHSEPELCASKLMETLNAFEEANRKILANFSLEEYEKERKGYLLAELAKLEKVA